MTVISIQSQVAFGHVGNSAAGSHFQEPSIREQQPVAHQQRNL